MRGIGIGIGYRCPALPYCMIKIHDMAAALTSIRQNADTGTGTDTITATATSISLIERRSNDEKLTYVLYFFNNLAILYKQYRTFI